MAEGPKYHVDNLAKSLLDVGDELLASRSHETFRLRELASMVPDKRGGVSHTAVFGHYDSMPDYLVALAARRWAQLEDALHFSSSADTPVELGLRYVEFALDNPHPFRLMYDSELWGLSDSEKVDGARFKEMELARDRCFAQFVLAARAAPWGQSLSSDAVQLRARLFAALAHGMASEFLDERLLAGRGNSGRKAQMQHARELLTLAVEGAAKT